MNNNINKVKLGDILTENKIESLSTSTDKRIRVRLNVKGVEQRPVTNEKTGATKYYTRRAGQFIYGKQNLFKGAFGTIPDELDSFETSSDLPAFDVKECSTSKWVCLFLRYDKESSIKH